MCPISELSKRWRNCQRMCFCSKFFSFVISRPINLHIHIFNYTSNIHYCFCLISLYPLHLKMVLRPQYYTFVWTLWISYERWNDVVFLFSFAFFFIFHQFLTNYKGILLFLWNLNFPENRTRSAILRYILLLWFVPSVEINFVSEKSNLWEFN